VRRSEIGSTDRSYAMLYIPVDSPHRVELTHIWFLSQIGKVPEKNAFSRVTGQIAGENVGSEKIDPLQLEYLA
jgi:hypothetical protein